MRIALIADTFPPLRTSGAIQLRDLAREIVRQGHVLTILLPSPDQHHFWKLVDNDGMQLLFLKAPCTKDIGFVRRTLNEFLMPFAMLRGFRKSPLANEQWGLVVWYAPSIFHGPLVSALKKRCRCKSYLIIRDIFPEWAVDMGLMRRGGVPYRFFDVIARYQYSIADVIGVQSPGNLSYFSEWQREPGRRLEVLQNWLGRASQSRCPIRLSESPLAGRKIFVYAGNMGIAQSTTRLLDLAMRFRDRDDVGFLFVGRGSEVGRLKTLVRERKQGNVLLLEEIDPDEIPDLYSQCSIGMIALDPRHKSHNIPGKFLTYLQSGLPVLANINSGNDLAQMIRSTRVGEVCEYNDLDELVGLANRLLGRICSEPDLPERCRDLFLREFSVTKTVKQIVSAASR